MQKVLILTVANLLLFLLATTAALAQTGTPATDADAAPAPVAVPAPNKSPPAAPPTGQNNSGAGTPYSQRIENVIPDITEREQSHTRTYHGPYLTQENFSYADGSTKCRYFNFTSGKVNSELEEHLPNGIRLRWTVYLDGGGGKEKVHTVFFDGKESKVVKEFYGKDGKTVWKVVTETGPYGIPTVATEYLNAAGKVTLKERKYQSQTTYTFYNKKGKEVYKQEWVTYTNGDMVLFWVTETPKDGKRRLFNVKGKTIAYLKDDGSIENNKVERYDGNSAEQPAPEHLKAPEIPQQPD